jgi:hypothetical protein
MRQFRTYESVLGVSGNRHPYRDPKTDRLISATNTYRPKDSVKATCFPMLRRYPESTKPRSARNGLHKALALQKVTRHTAAPLGVLRNHLVLRRASIHNASSRVVALGPDRTIRSDLVSHYAVHWECQRKWGIRPNNPYLQPVRASSRLHYLRGHLQDCHDVRCREFLLAFLQRYKPSPIRSNNWTVPFSLHRFSRASRMCWW